MSVLFDPTALNELQVKKWGRKSSHYIYSLSTSHCSDFIFSRPVITWQEEASFLCNIHHPNIVRFYGVSIDASKERGASYYLVSALKDTDLRSARRPIIRSACIFL